MSVDSYSLNGDNKADPSVELKDGDRVTIRGQGFTAHETSPGAFDMVPEETFEACPDDAPRRMSRVKKQRARAQRKKLKKHRKR